MKLIPIVIFSFIIIQSCKCHSKATHSVSKSPDKTSKVIPQDSTIQIEYRASTRGFYQKIRVVNGKISTTKKRGKNAHLQAISKNDWEQILVVLNHTKLENISELLPPSQDFQFDGAPLARLKIISNGKTYETQGFDHGNPPKEVAELVKEILSISENIE